MERLTSAKVVVDHIQQGKRLMPKFFEEDADWDEGCANCGERHYKPSTIPGICVDCSSEAYTGSVAFEDAQLSDWDTGWL